MPKTTVPVLVTRLLEGTLWIISAAFCSGGGLEPLAIERLQCKGLEGFLVRSFQRTQGRFGAVGKRPLAVVL